MNDASFLQSANAPKVPSVEERKRKDLQERITQIETLQLGAGQLASLILVILNEKPATEVDVFQHSGTPDEIRSVLQHAQLAVGQKEASGPLVARFAVARDQKTLAELMKAEGYQDHRAYGLLMGFPETAVDAFVHGNPLPADQRPVSTFLGPTFTLSKDHWREELEVQQRWINLLQEYAPAVYKKLVPEPREESTESPHE